MQYYVEGNQIIFDKGIYNEGEESTLHHGPNQCLVKLWKQTRRKNLAPLSVSFYQGLMEITTYRFYLPKKIIFDQEGNFAGYIMDQFKFPEKFSHAQKKPLTEIIEELKLIESDIEKLSKNHILLGDIHFDNFLSNDKGQIGVVDCGGYQKSDHPNLYLQNLKEMNYYLREGLLWRNYQGNKNEMVGIDFPEQYDILDQEESYLSDILKHEQKKHKVKTLQELKQVYQRMKFY